MLVTGLEFLSYLPLLQSRTYFLSLKFLHRDVQVMASFRESIWLVLLIFTHAFASVWVPRWNLKILCKKMQLNILSKLFRHLDKSFSFIPFFIYNIFAVKLHGFELTCILLAAVSLNIFTLSLSHSWLTHFLLFVSCSSFEMTVRMHNDFCNGHKHSL